VPLENHDGIVTVVIIGRGQADGGLHFCLSARHAAQVQTSKSFSFLAKFATSPLKIQPICRHGSFRLTLDALMAREMNGWDLPNKIK
jgi:hypothetical protein